MRPMNSEEVKQEIARDPYLPLRLHLNNGRKIDLPYQNMGWLQRTALLVVHRLGPRTQVIDSYDVIELGLIERIEQLPGPAGA
jgi:hypothetical protein